MKKLRKILNEMILKINEAYPTEVSEEMLLYLIDEVGFSQIEAHEFAKNYESILKEIKIPLIDDDASPSELLEIFDAILGRSSDLPQFSVKALDIDIPQTIMMDLLAFLGDAKEEDDEDVYFCKLLKGSSALYDIFEIVGMTPSCARVRSELERTIEPLGLKRAE